MCLVVEIFIWLGDKKWRDIVVQHLFYFSKNGLKNL